MEMEYSKKDIKKAPKIKEGEIRKHENGEVFLVTLGGSEHMFVSKDEAEEFLKKSKK